MLARHPAISDIFFKQLAAATSRTPESAAVWLGLFNFASPAQAGRATQAGDASAMLYAAIAVLGGEQPDAAPASLFIQRRQDMIDTGVQLSRFSRWVLLTFPTDANVSGSLIRLCHSLSIVLQQS